MSRKTKRDLKKEYNYLSIIAIIVLWFFLFSWIFYEGSINAGMWKKWQGLEIVIPIMISFFISLIIVLLIYLILRFLKKLIMN